MQNEYVYVIGLMSGTSLDGIDLVYVTFNKKNYKDFEILYSTTYPYSSEWKNLLKQAITFSDEKLTQLDIQYGIFLGETINSFIEENDIYTIDFIASHGHTVFHQPENGITLQIGSGQEIANITNHKVICDFRTQDVKLGGQGAPLVPIGDELLFADYDYCINLGGFANVSFKQNSKRIAFDICPVNIVMNHYAQQLGFEYDEDGKIASEGKINQELLDKLNSLEFYQKEPPKSLGLEWVQKEVFPLIDSLENDVPSILRTFVEHCAIQIASVIENNSLVLITGGGAFNTFLVQKIEEKSNLKIKLPSNELINFKEALIFAFLGVLRNENKVNCLQSVTGAKKNHSSGKIFNPV
ncbi:anhydro-N-acetylmuramic acid kinase [Tenacibaculum sp. IB213877]|uniref:anhydro-N-acetylmuramic acid kinase n=1 Tax=Tenacibaculum sp. IB213877 TaxID=3097351 RepID=UPI002A599044|nr:anhydro-N-acetylmuramic acid kinase [Tenacibaculum sp. IB213877]MDY0781354.1 anhydro-N-acetylmuramic acid kinase [Tenacibaculum sp. IB213877]